MKLILLLSIFLIIFINLNQITNSFKLYKCDSPRINLGRNVNCTFIYDNESNNNNFNISLNITNNENINIKLIRSVNDSHLFDVTVASTFEPITITVNNLNETISNFQEKSYFACIDEYYYLPPIKAIAINNSTIKLNFRQIYGNRNWCSIDYSDNPPNPDNL